MGSGRVSINTFSSRSRLHRGIFSEEDMEGLFDAGDEKGKHGQRRNEIQDLGVAGSTSGDVFDGLLNMIPSDESTEEDCQAREDLDDVPARVQGTDDDDEDGDDDDDINENGGGFREGVLTDEESMLSESQDNDMSTLMSDSSLVVPKPWASSATPLDCLDGDKELLVATIRQYAANIDDMNQFLFQELEVEGFVGEVEQLRQELVKTGLEKLDKVQWADLFKSIYGSYGGVQQEQQLTLASAAAEDRNVSSSAVLERPCRGCIPDMNDFVIEEGMEMPYFCGDFVTSDCEPQTHPLPEKKKQSILTKIFQGHKRDPPSRFSATHTGKPEVTRVKLVDGSMASVSVDTVSKLQKCQWV